MNLLQLRLGSWEASYGAVDAAWAAESHLHVVPTALLVLERRTGFNVHCHSPSLRILLANVGGVSSGGPGKNFPVLRYSRLALGHILTAQGWIFNPLQNAVRSSRDI